MDFITDRSRMANWQLTHFGGYFEMGRVTYFVALAAIFGVACFKSAPIVNRSVDKEKEAIKLMAQFQRQVGVSAQCSVAAMTEISESVKAFAGKKLVHDYIHDVKIPESCAQAQLVMPTDGTPSMEDVERILGKPDSVQKGKWYQQEAISTSSHETKWHRYGRIYVAVSETSKKERYGTAIVYVYRGEANLAYVVVGQQGI